eukprot:g3841.t1
MPREGLDVPTKEGSVATEPKHTLYIRNLNEALSKSKLEEELKAAFAQFGEILTINVSKRQSLHGQAWVTFKDMSAAEAALETMKGFPHHGKDLQVSYARVENDIITKANGTFQHRPLRSAPKPDTAMSTTDSSSNQNTATVENPPHNVLFVQNLPDGTTKDELVQLFADFTGFVKVRIVISRGIAFIDFENVICASMALKEIITIPFKGQPLNVVFAKK